MTSTLRVIKVLELSDAAVMFVIILYTGQKATIHQVTTMLATSKNVLFPGHNHLQTTGADDPSL